MTTFLMICALLLAVAVLFVVLPLWRSRVKSNQVVRDAANLEIFRDQIAEMETDLNNGLLTQELYDQGKRELQARMLEEVKSTEAGFIAAHPHRKLAIVLALALPLLAAGIYWKIGNQDALRGQSGRVVSGEFGVVHTDAALRALEDKVSNNPKDTESLLILARSYLEMERYVDAAKTYNKLTQLVPNDAQLWADFADALGMAAGQKLSGHPTMLIDKALAIDPNNPKALALAGSAAMERGDFAKGIAYWEKLLPMLDKGSENARMIEEGLREARAAMAGGGKQAPMMGGGAPAAEAAAGKERINGTVSLGAAVKDKVGPNDMVFILARAESGPPMPLAVMRKQVKDLPMEFSLDDSMAMAPQMRLSNFDKVVVVARVSKSGDPMPHSGDLQGTSATLKPGTGGVKLVIDTVVK